MKVAAIYDIHGNLPALEAVIADVRASSAEEIVFGGDIIPGPMPVETLDFLASIDLPVRFIHGNGDRTALEISNGADSSKIPEAYRETMRWNADQLTASHKHLIATWPSTLNVNIKGLGRVLFCHATPANDTDIFTRLTPETRLASLFAGVEADTVICGHTHMQFDIKVGKTRVVNAGSVGMPFGKTGAHWVLLGPDVEFRRSMYDLDKAAAIIGKTNYPQREQFAATSVLNPPSEEQILANFARADG